MATTTTTLSGAISTTATQFGVASVANITNPNHTTGVGVTMLLIDSELMRVEQVRGSSVFVSRGQGGSPSATHAGAATVTVGGYTDFTPANVAITAAH